MEVQYQRMYSIGQFLNERIGFEMEIPDDGDPVEEIKILKKLCDKAHEAINPVPFDETPIEQPKENAPTKEQGLIQVIQLCNTLTSLERFRKEVERSGNEQVQNAFGNKLKQLK